eukprot:2988740-Pleurochrysis_carterae.AAC.1
MLEALRRGSSTKAQREEERRAAGGAAQPALSMPTAELFGAWAVAKAVCARLHDGAEAVIA